MLIDCEKNSEVYVTESREGLELFQKILILTGLYLALFFANSRGEPLNHSTNSHVSIPKIKMAQQAQTD